MARTYKVSNGMKLYEQVLEQIKTMIAQGVYKKGDLLPSEKELMDMMGVSRITVREALRLLSEAGVIETHKGKGSFVKVDSSELIRDLDYSQDYRQSFLHATDARIMLEPVVAAYVAEHASQEEIEQLEKSFSESSPSEAFHSAIMDLAHNPIITNMHKELSQYEEDPVLTHLIPPSRQKHVGTMLENQHRKVFEAIRDRKPDYAYFYMKEHLEYVRKTYEEYFDVFHI